MSTTPTPAAAPSLEQFVRDDVIDGLMDEGFTREQAESGIACGTGVTFSQLFTTSLNWLMLQRHTGRPIPATRKEAPMQTQTTSVAKPNGHAPVLQEGEKRCAGYKRECSEILAAKNRTGFCTTCYARKNYHDNQAAKGKPAKAHAKPSRRDRVEVLDPAPPVAARVSLEVTEAQLNQFLVRLSLADKQRLANHFLQSAEENFAA